MANKAKPVPTKQAPSTVALWQCPKAPPTGSNAPDGATWGNMTAKGDRGSTEYRCTNCGGVHG